MHELAIAQNIVSVVARELERHGGGRVLKVRLRVGEISGVEIESLKFCYEATVNDSPLEGSDLEVERIPLQYVCPGCGGVFHPEGFSRTCPFCRNERTEMRRGTELEIVDFEIE